MHRIAGFSLTTFSLFLIVGMLHARDAAAQDDQRGVIDVGSDNERSSEAAQEQQGEQTSRQRRESGIVLPGLRIAPGIGVHPGRDETVKFDLDVAAALLIGFSAGEAIVGIVTELGYVYHVGHDVGGHYGAITLGLMVGRAISGTAFSTLLLGRRADLFDIGVRAGLRVEVAYGVLGLEVAYERRMSDVGNLDSAHIGFAFDVVRLIAAIFMVSLLRRPVRSAVRAGRRVERWLNDL